MISYESYDYNNWRLMVIREELLTVEEALIGSCIKTYNT
jgi:hypothetical protein